MTRDDDAAADVVQRALTKAFLNAGDFEGRAALRTWVWRIAINEGLQWRRASERRERHLATFAAQLALDRADGPESPYEAVERRERFERLSAALEALSDTDRDILESVLAGGLRDWIEATGCAISEKTLRTRLHRARRRLRSALEVER